jgi:hypothetical protein
VLPPIRRILSRIPLKSDPIHFPPSLAHLSPAWRDPAARARASRDPISMQIFHGTV